MNYEEMVDLTIDRKVFVQMYGECIGDKDMDRVWQQGKFRPCSNPSDAWPIIADNGICITSPTTGRKHKLWSASWNEDGGRWSCGDITHGDKNPLRAAMICFLKMKDAENE